MIDSIKLNDFKAFKDSGYINLKKINILVGPNSSGKSSFIKSLLILNNSIKNKDNSSILTLNKDVGNFKNIVFSKSKGDMFSYTIRFSNENRSNKNSKTNINIAKDLGINLFNITKQIINKNKSKDQDITSMLQELIRENFRYDIEEVYIAIKETTSKRVVIERFNMKFTNGECSEIYRGRNSYYIKFNDINIKKANIVKQHKFYFLIDTNKLKGMSVEELKIISILDYVLGKFEKQMIRFSNKMIHLKPLRNEFERLEYVTNLTIEESVGEKGENTLTTLLGIENNDDKKELKDIIKNDINEWLDKFDLGKSVNIATIGNDNYSLEIKNKYTGLKNNILDVGVGTAQLLPILVESINSKEGSLLIIEEPETHIHPKAQSLLADLFVECVNKRNKRFIIETHSIFLILKLQILVAKGLIKPNDIGIYYFNQSVDGTTAKDMVLNENGQFNEEWPSGFFDIHYGLGSELIRSM